MGSNAVACGRIGEFTSGQINELTSRQIKRVDKFISQQMALLTAYCHSMNLLTYNLSNLISTKTRSKHHTKCPLITSP